MKNNFGREFREMSHIMMAVCAFSGSIIITIVNLLKGWDIWTVPVFLAGGILCLVIHVAGFAEEAMRPYICAGVIFTELFYYIMKAEDPYTAVPVVVLVIVVVSSMESAYPIWWTVAVGFFGILFRTFLQYIRQGERLHTADTARLFWYLLLIISAGMLLSGMNVMLRSLQAFYEGKILALQEETRLADDFMAGISREISMPVEESIALAEASIPKEQDPSIREKLQSICLAGRRVTDQVQDVVDFSQLEVGRISYEGVDYSLKPVIAELTERLLPFKKKDTELVIDVDPSIPAVIRSDRDKVARVLWHVIQNALKYTVEGGVYVRISHVLHGHGMNLDIVVEDSGEGMNDEELGRIYERFYRSEQKKQISAEGLGLGMPIVSGLLNVLGGFITIDSSIGMGTKIHISIPHEIIDPSPCMTVRGAEELSVGGYLMFDKYSDPNVREYYNALMRHMVGGLGLKFYRVNSMRELQELTGKRSLTHVFIGEEQYWEDADVVESLAERLSVVLICDEAFRPKEGSGAILLNKPFYCFPVIRILEGEKPSPIKKPEPVEHEAPEEKPQPVEEADPRKEKEDAASKALYAAGIDVKLGLEWCMNDPELFLGVMQEFLNDSLEKKEELERFMEEGDAENFAIRIHSIKSSSKMIGAMSLSEAAEALEKAARKGDRDHIRKHFPEFMPEYERVLLAIRAHEGIQKPEREGEGA